jgi:hypothetical protein
MATNQADRLEQAIQTATALVGDLVQLRAEVEALREQVPDLVGPGEIAEILQVHPGHISRLRKAGRIPAPIAELKDGPVWLRAQFTFPNTLKETD